MTAVRSLAGCLPLQKPPERRHIFLLLSAGIRLVRKLARRSIRFFFQSVPTAEVLTDLRVAYEIGLRFFPAPHDQSFFHVFSRGQGDFRRFDLESHHRRLRDRQARGAMRQYFESRDPARLCFAPCIFLDWI